MVKEGYYIPVLSYHRISPDEWYYNDTTQFEAHLAYLQQNGYTPITLDKFYQYFKGLLSNEQMPQKPVAISFDDGLRCVYEYAYPLFKKYGATFTFFLITSEIRWPHTPADRKGSCCCWDEIREMVNGCGMMIGVHSHMGHHWGPANDAGDNCGVLAQPLYKPNGIAPLGDEWLRNYQRYWAFPFAGTTYNYVTGELLPVTAWFTITASQSITISVIWVKPAVPVPSDTWYDALVDIYINDILVKSGWQIPKWVEVTGYTTWLMNMWCKIPLDTPVAVSAGETVTVKFVTTNLHSSQAEHRLFFDYIPGMNTNMFTTGWSGDYEPDPSGIASYSGYPLIVLSDGTGMYESEVEFRARVREDYQRAKLLIETYAGNCVQMRYERNAEADVIDPIDEAPFCGAVKYVEWVEVVTDEQGNVIAEIPRYYFSRIRCELDVVLNSGGTFCGIRVSTSPRRRVGWYKCLIDVYVDGRLVASRAEPQWGESQFFIPFDQPVTLAAGQHTITTQTLNQTWVWDGDQYIEGHAVILVGVKEYTYYWDEETGEGIPPDQWVYRVRWYDDQDRLINQSTHAPYIEFCEEINSYPNGKYEPPNGIWIYAYPFGMYSEPLIEELKAQGVAQMFTIEANRFDPRPVANPACVTRFEETPRLTMYNDNYIAAANPGLEPANAFPVYLTTFTMERFSYYLDRLPPLRVVAAYELWIEGIPVSHDLLLQIDKLDMVIFDAYNFDRQGNVVGGYSQEAKTFVKGKNRLALAMFGNFNPELGEFDPEIARYVFTNSTSAISAILDKLNNEGWDGCATDFEDVYPEDRELATQFFRQLALALHTNQPYKLLLVAAPYPFNNSPTGVWDKWFDYVEIGKVADYVSPMTYLDHGPWSEPGPICDYTNFIKNYTEITKMIPAYKVLVGLPLFGCMWFPDGQSGEKNPLEITAWGLEHMLVPYFDPVSKEAVINKDGVGVAYMPTPSGLAMRMEEAAKLGCGGVAFWRLGTADANYFKPWASFTARKMFSHYYLETV